MEAMNGSVFIERDPMENHGFSVEISEKALTKNLMGTIRHVENDKIVTKNDRVHIPHYNVEDLKVNGEEYAVVKVGELFAVEVDGAFLPINSYVKIRKCVNDDVRDSDGNVVLYMTDKYIETTNWVEIIDVAEDCKHFTKEDIGRFCIAPENDNLLARLLRSEEFMLHETKIQFVTDGEGMIKPKNNMVVVERLVIDNDSPITLPDSFTTETELWTVISYGDGIRNKNGDIIPVDLQIGSTVIIKEGSYINVGVDGKDYAMVSESDIVIEIGE